jgi:UDP-glucose 4-epimerase
MIVLVTGARGFIGRYVMQELEDRGYIPLAYDLSDGHDILNRDQLAEHMEWADAVIHLAGVLGTHELFDDIHHTIDVNIKGAVNVLDTCVLESKPFVMIEQPHIWYNPYEATKAAAHRLAMAYHLDYKVPVAFVETYNAYGPGQAHGPGHPQKIIPTFATRSWEGKPIEIWGDGMQEVDLIAAPDAADCLVSALEGSLSGATTFAGTGHGVTVLQAAEIVRAHVAAETVEWPPYPVHHPMRRGENTQDLGIAVAPGLPYPMRWDYLAETIDSYREQTD